MLKLSEFFEVPEEVEFRMSNQENLIFKIQDNVLMSMSIRTLKQWQECNLGINELIHSKITILSSNKKQRFNEEEKKTLKAIAKFYGEDTIIKKWHNQILFFDNTTSYHFDITEEEPFNGLNELMSYKVKELISEE